MTGKVQRVAQAIALAGVLALLGLLVWKVAFDRQGGVAAEIAAGKPVRAPAFELERLDRDGMLTMSALKGKAVVVNFWASWCGPCRDETPFLQKTYEQYRGRGLVVLGIDVNDYRPDARRFMERFGVTYPVVFDGRGSLIGKWGVTGYPETYFVDRHGKVVGDRIVAGADLDKNQAAFERGLALALGDAS